MEDLRNQRNTNDNYVGGGRESGSFMGSVGLEDVIKMEGTWSDLISLELYRLCKALSIDGRMRRSNELALTLG